MLKLFFGLILLATSIIAQATPAQANQCVQSVRAAVEAYEMSVYDAQQVDTRAFERALNFRVSMQPFPADKYRATNAGAYIASRLKVAGVRAVDDVTVTWVAQEYIQGICISMVRE